MWKRLLLFLHQIFDIDARGLKHLTERIVEGIVVLLQGVPLVGRCQSLLPFLGLGAKVTRTGWLLLGVSIAMNAYGAWWFVTRYAG